MRTAEAAAAATPVIQAAMGEAGGAADPVRFGLVVPGAGADPAAAAVVEQVLDGIPGVVTAEVDQRSRDTAVLIVTTADTAAAFAAQQALTADPATLLPYRSLQFTVENADRPGSLLRALATSDTGHVGNLDRAAALAETDGILGGVMVTPTALGATLTKDADVATVAAALKAAALRDQEAEIFVETAWEPYRPEAAYSFDVLGKLHPDLINGNGDQDAFVKAWNAAPGL